MTESEAIEAIQFDLKIGGEIHSQVLRDAIDVAIQALEKQIPKKPLYIANLGGTALWLCPVCERRIIRSRRIIKSNLVYCHQCGQKLDWSEEE